MMTTPGVSEGPSPGLAEGGTGGHGPGGHGPGGHGPGGHGPAGGRGPWQAIAGLSARTPLRVKLMTSLLALVIAAVAGISIAGAFVFRDYVHATADRTVTRMAVDTDLSLQKTGAHGFRPTVVCFGPFVIAFVPSGQRLTSCPNAVGPSVPTSRAWLQANSRRLVTVPATTGGGSWRVITMQGTYPSADIPGYPVSGTVVAAEDLGNINQSVGRLVSIDLIVGAIVVLGLAIVGIALVRTSLQPLAEIERTAGEIAAGDLTRRVAEHDPRTEVGSLGQSLNAMLAQIEAAFRAQAQSEANARWSEARMRRFAADASHELRTPLTAIKGYAEYYRQRGGVAPNGHGQLPAEDLDRIMHRVEDEATRMGLLVEDLLLLARVDQQRPLDRRPVDMLALAADAVQDARAIAPGREVRLTVGRNTAFLVIGDEAKLRQVVGNLMNNALTHTPDGTPIEVHVRSGVLRGWASPPAPGPGSGPAFPAAGPGKAGPWPAGPGLWPGPAGPAAGKAPAAPAAPGPAGPAVWPWPAGRVTYTPGGGPADPAAAAGSGWIGPAASTAGAGSSGLASQPVPAIVLEVADQGPGMAKEQAERVFERFYRADQARTRETGGTGLGLAIVYALVTAHDGEVSVDTAPGQGATFRVVLPLAPEAQNAGWDEPGEQQEHDGDEPDAHEQHPTGSAAQTGPFEQQPQPPPAPEPPAPPGPPNPPETRPDR